MTHDLLKWLKIPRYLDINDMNVDVSVSIVLLVVATLGCFWIASCDI